MTVLDLQGLRMVWQADSNGDLTPAGSGLSEATCLPPSNVSIGDCISNLSVQVCGSELSLLLCK
jgi:hypothetical protein